MASLENGEGTRRISVTVCGSQREVCVSGFIEFLQKSYPQIIADVKYEEIPYNSIDSFRFSGPVDVVILVHSIYNRRMAITNVPDALFNKFLPMAKRLVGHEKLAILVHDMSYPIDRKEMDQRMCSFHDLQPLAFQCSDLVMTCGKLDDKQPIQIDDMEMTRMKMFLEHTQSLPPPSPSKGTNLVFYLVLAVGALVIFLLSKKGVLSDFVSPVQEVDSGLDTEL
ncbi:uncharacterized protein [Diadema setosum]|uniref:uncharacterized protein n=1 Tax=Diadema setosum TaxID=31175 RepID=UPI003B3B80D4